MVGVPLLQCSTYFSEKFAAVGSQAAIRPVPPAALMTQSLNINSLFIQSPQTRRPENQSRIELIRDISSEVRILEDIQLFRREKMTVNVDDLNTPVADGYLAAFRWCGLKK